MMSNNAADYNIQYVAEHNAHFGDYQQDGSWNPDDFNFDLVCYLTADSLLTHGTDFCRITLVLGNPTHTRIRSKFSQAAPQ